MKSAYIAGAVALAVLGWWAARSRTSPPAGAGASPPSAEALAQLRTLEAILASKNDNDPRLDSDFRVLSPDARRAFREKYASLPLEARNERGTIVYLLGRVADAPADWDFLRAVAAEPPCLSLDDCAKRSKSADQEALGDEVTLAYPSLVALKSAQRALDEPRAAKGAMSVLEAGRTSRAPAVARLAAVLERRYGARAALSSSK